MISALFHECTEKLSPHVKILSQDKTDAIFDILENMFPTGMTSRIMWKEMDPSYYSVLQETTEIIPILKNNP